MQYKIVIDIIQKGRLEIVVWMDNFEQATILMGMLAAHPVVVAARLWNTLGEPKIVSQF